MADSPLIIKSKKFALQIIKVCNYIKQTRKETEFFDYDATGLSIGEVYYEYYYTENNEAIVPDFYSGDNMGEKFEDDKGIYFGKPNNGTDWCFVKQIINNWYYYELHWG